MFQRGEFEGGRWDGDSERKAPKPVTRKPAQGKDGEVNPGRRVSRKDFGSECTIS